MKTSQALSASKKLFCVPDNISEDDVVPRFIATVDADLNVFPKDKDESATAMVLQVIKRAFPCR